MAEFLTIEHKPHKEGRQIHFDQTWDKGAVIWMDISLWVKFRKHTTRLRLYHLLRYLNADHSGEIKQTPEELAQMLNLSPNTIRKHIRWMKDNGWIKQYGRSGRFWVVSIKKIKAKYDIYGQQVVNVSPFLSKREWEAVMYAAWKEAYRKWVAFEERERRRKMETPRDKKIRQLLKKAGQIGSRAPELPDQPLECSYSFDCKRLNASRNTIQRLIKDACAFGLIGYSYNKSLCYDSSVINQEPDNWYWSSAFRAFVKNSQAKIHIYIQTSKRRYSFVDGESMHDTHIDYDLERDKRQLEVIQQVKEAADDFGLELQELNPFYHYRLSDGLSPNLDVYTIGCRFNVLRKNGKRWYNFNYENCYDLIGQWFDSEELPRDILEDYHKMPFGKYRNCYMQDVPADYLLWIDANYTNLDPAIKAYIANKRELLESECDDNIKE